MTTATELALHPFEKAGLGKAPFRFVGISEKVCSGQPGTNGISVGYSGQPAGTCDYCGMGIRYCCHIVSADKREFVVGCDCVMKLERSDNALVADVDREKKVIDRKKRMARKEARMEPEKVRIEAARKLIEQKRASLEKHPHPMITGLTLADYVDWLNRMASHSGLLRMAKIIEST